MGEYVYSIILAAVFAALVYAASPSEGAGAGISKFVAFCGALCVALTVVIPLCSGSVAELDTLILPQQSAVSEKTEQADFSREAESLGKSLAVSFSVAYGVDMGDFSVTVSAADGESFVPEKIMVHLKKQLSSASDAEKKLSQIFACPVKIETE